MTYTLIFYFMLTQSNPTMIVVKNITEEKACVELAQKFADAFETQAQYQCKKEITT